MKILDLRPWWTRLAHSLWQGNGESGQGGSDKPRPAGRGIGSIISNISRQRLKNRPPAPERPFIVSVGNLALGGTGKTPVVSALACDLARMGIAGAVLTRGYRSLLSGPVLVTPDLIGAGDEARLLAKNIQPSGWIVVQAKNRLEGLRWLQQNGKPLDIVIAEDAHQTPNLPRHLDVLIIDRWYVETESRKKYVSAVSGQIFPFGPYREDSRGAERAGIWLLENEGWDNVGCRLGREISIASFTREIVLPADNGAGKNYGALSGIARPWRFEAALNTQMGYEPVLAVRCNDHDSYDPQLVQKIVSAASAARADRILTTAKDWVKLQDVWPGDLPLQVAGLKISWGKGQTLPDLVRERFLSHSNPAD